MSDLVFIGCPWCALRVQGCRCASSCGAEHCAAAFYELPAAHTIKLIMGRLGMEEIK